MLNDEIQGSYRWESLSDDRAELLRLMLRSKSGKSRRIQAIPRRSGSGGFQAPLSYSQRRLWFIDQLEGAGAAYHLPAAVRLHGELDVPALQSTLDTLVQRHEVLRTVFAVGESEPIQVIASEQRFALQRIDLSQWEAAARETEIQRQARDEASAHFDLSRGPLIRGRLLKVSDREHVLLVTLHHIVSDGWSMGVLIRELGILYTAYKEGRSNPLPELPIQYADYAQWQRQWLVGEVLQGQLNYWQQHLAGAPSLLELPTDRVRPAVQSYRGDSISMRLGTQLSSELKSLARRVDATLYMVLYAGFAIVLSRLSGQRDVVIGTPVANRQRTELEGLIGFFVNTLALRTTVDTDASVLDLLKQVKELTLSGYAHQEVPFEQVVEALQPPRSLSHSSVFQVMFALQNAPRSALQLPGLTLAPQGMSAPTAQFDLSLSLQEAGDDILGTLNYASDLFERTTIERWLGYFKTVLQEMARDTQQRVGALRLLSEAEEQALAGFNATEAAYSRQALIHELFERQVDRTPDAFAVIYGSERLTYGQLNERANQLARYLQDRGVGTAQPIAVCVERGVEMVIGLLGVLKAGGVYTPLDPAYPAQRLQYMLSDAAPRVVLTQEQFKDSLSTLDASVVTLDSEWPQIAQYSDLNAVCLDLTPQHPAYVIYTSGSTGAPKGTVMTHTALVNLIEWQRSDASGDRPLRTAQFAALGFDVCLQEVFSTLCTGGTLLPIHESVRRDPRALARTLRESEVQRLFLPFIALQGLAEAVDSTSPAPSSLQEVITAGEQLRVTPAIARLFEKLPGCRLHNHYGPTESHVVTSFLLAGAPAGWPELPPIGRPIRNVQIHVLDERRRQVPVGAVGEIYIGGVAVAHGYLNLPQLTAERFLRDPFSADPQSRLYKTGDLGRWRSDGTLEYTGRNDHQVKIRGYRIELGEIEVQLGRHEQVKEAVVTVRADRPGEKRLVAYVTVHDLAVGAETLRSHLGEHLPSYMVPAAFVVLERLPLTPSGKIDRQALPAPELDAYATREYQVPQGEIETSLAQIWEELLQIDTVGRHDNFFDLGGHSLLAVQMLARVGQRLGRELALREVFEFQTVQALAQRLGATDETIMAPIEPADRGRALPLSLSQQRLWFIDQLEGAGAAYHLPAAVRLHGELDVSALQSTLDTLVQRHELLRTVFAVGESEPIQVIAREQHFALQRIDLSQWEAAVREAEIQRQAQEEASARFDLSRGPLIRGRLLKVSDREHVLLVTLHHIVSDGWSMGVLIRELGILYSAYKEGRSNPLPELPIQYADYAQWQRQWLVGEILQGQLSYWQQHLAGAPSLLELPTDRVRPAVQSYRGDSISMRLGTQLSSELKSLARRVDTTLYMVLYAGFAIVLSRLSGQRDVVIGTPVANRQRTELEGLIGFFVNTLALRTTVDADAGVLDLLKQVKELTLSGYAHQEVPFEQVVEALQPPRSLSHSPVFQVMFAFQNTPRSTLELSGLTLAPQGVGTPTAQFDLSLSMQEVDGEIFGALNYASDLFERASIERWVGYLKTVFAGMVRESQQRIGSLPLLGEAERQQVLKGFNATDAAYPQDALIHELFEAQVERTPQAVAVIFEAEELTYAELNRRANQLAHYLRTVGVGPDGRVALCLERSIEMVVGLLGILKAGGAYVPLDPAYPKDRLQYMLSDAAPCVVLTQERLKDTLLLIDVPVIAIDSQWPQIANQPDTKLAADELGLTSRHLVYVIYTSGSTGEPKGVMIEHTSVVNFLKSMQREPGIDAQDCWLAVTTLSFDIAALEIYLPLLSGARVVVASRDMSTDPQQLLAALERFDVSVMQATPATWQLLIDAEWRGSAKLKALCGGEALTTDLADQIRSRSASLWNLYGPTETTIWSCVQQVDPGAARRQPIESIGRPIANTQLYILDEQLQPAPIAVTGEIYIGGAGVARGYLNRPELTQARFIDDRFSTRDGARLYKTGDLGRWRADGTVEYLGRNDHQLKMRGYRIEPGEIEAVLRKHPQVQEAVVVARDLGPADRRLVGYVVPRPSERTDATATGELGFSLFFFGADTHPADDKYDLYLRAAKFADEHGFEAIWTPERHFDAVGALFPNPSVLSAALATMTSRVQLRAGSVVLPLHDPIRVAEEWAVVDNLSRGRVGLAIASGWHPRDFVFATSRFASRRETMLESIRTLRDLWAGKTIQRVDGGGRPADIRIFPSPVQDKLPLWITAAASPQTFIEAGRLGANVLTHQISNSTSELAEKIELYRAALKSYGHDPAAGRVTVMIHTFLGQDLEAVLARARTPFMNYMRAHLGLQASLLTSLGIPSQDLTEAELDSATEFAFERYVSSASLIGTPHTALEVVNRLRDVGVDEVACLIDWIDRDAALEALGPLRELRDLARAPRLGRSALMSHCRSWLPEYMVPSVYVQLDDLPKTANGKLDRQALPPPQADEFGADRYEAPQGELETSLAAIWSDVLRLERVGRHDNFFDLGGHSLLAMQLVTRTQQVLGCILTLRDVFQFPTLQDLARRLDESRRKDNACLADGYLE